MLNIWAHNLKMTKIGVRSNTYNIVVSTSNSNTESQIIDRGGRGVEAQSPNYPTNRHGFWHGLGVQLSS
jgi:hypothetical protein